MKDENNGLRRKWKAQKKRRNFKVKGENKMHEGAYQISREK